MHVCILIRLKKKTGHYYQMNLSAQSYFFLKVYCWQMLAWIMYNLLTWNISLYCKGNEEGVIYLVYFFHKKDFLTGDHKRLLLCSPIFSSILWPNWSICSLQKIWVITLEGGDSRRKVAESDLQKILDPVAGPKGPKNANFSHRTLKPERQLLTINFGSYTQI